MPNPRPSHRSGPTKPPPPRNYLSRNEQLRLLLMVGSLMLVFIAMNEARKPKYWKMFAPAADSSAESAADQSGGGKIDTRLNAVRTADRQRLPGEIVAEGFNWRPEETIDDQDLARHQAEKDFWRQQMELLPYEQRNDLPRVLHAVRSGEALDEEDAGRWESTLATLDQRWQEYSQQAMDAVTSDQNLQDEDRAAWLLILHQMQKRWDDRLHDALASAADPSKLTDAQREELGKFQSLFDEMSMDIVRDDTVVSRKEEKNAIYRVFEDLQKADQQALQQADAPRVGFRQLFNQPDQYRRQLVHIEGVARQAYRVRAPRNMLGIEQFYVFTIFPARGSSDPILVYSLGVPEGFPAIKDKDIDKEVTLLKEPVEFTGYFFKRVAYPAKRDTMVAPLVFAKSPTWQPQPPEEVAELPGMWSVLTAVLGAALLGVAVAYIVFLRHRRTPSQRYGPAARATPQDLAALHDMQLSPTPSETMAQLAEQSASPEDEAARE